MTATPARKLRELLAGPDLVRAPGAYDGITARLIEQAAAVRTELVRRILIDPLQRLAPIIRLGVRACAQDP